MTCSTRSATTIIAMLIGCATAAAGELPCYLGQTTTDQEENTFGFVMIDPTTTPPVFSKSVKKFGVADVDPEKETYAYTVLNRAKTAGK